MAVKFWNTAKRVFEPSALDRLEAMGLSRLCAKVLAARGVEDSAAMRQIFGGRNELFDPFLLLDMKKAVSRVRMALEAGETVVVYGDYDCDGVTATALLYSYLETVGANVLYYIPDREVEGYGLNIEAIDFLSSVRGATLIITVDNGISAREEIEHANRLGIDVIVTDHHRPPETLPNAVAVVDPHRAGCPSPFKELAGVGVAFKLICALEGDDGSELLEHYGDLVALGTIGDVVQLTHDNRTFVRQGLRLIAEGARPGLAALIAAAGLGSRPLTAVDVAFGLVPRINAAGRMGDVYDALELLLTEDAEAAAAKAAQLCDYNTERKSTEGRILAEIEGKIAANPRLVQGRAIVMEGEGWHHGVVGILCSRLVERYGRPAFLISTDDREGRASGRSIEGVSVIQAVAACGSLLTRYGGHAQAAGFTVPLGNLSAFRRQFLAYLQEQYPIMPFYGPAVDCVVEPGELTVPQVESLARLEPFGTGNPAPVFEIDGARLDRIQPLSGGKHLKLALSKGEAAFQALLFGTGPEQFGFVPGDLLDLVVSASISVYNNTKSVSIKINDLRLAGLPQQEACYQRRVYENALAGAISREQAELICPSREDAAVVYRYLCRQGGFAGDADLLYQRLMGSIGYGKLLVALDALAELGLIAAGAGGYRVCPTAGKVDLMGAGAIRRLHEMR